MVDKRRLGAARPARRLSWRGACSRVGKPLTDRFVTMAHAMLVAIRLVCLILVSLFRLLRVPLVILFALPLVVIGDCAARAKYGLVRLDQMIELYEQRMDQRGERGARGAPGEG